MVMMLTKIFQKLKGVSFMYLPAATAKSLQLCPTLCDPIDGSPPGSPVPGILQPRTLEWVAISFSNAWKWKVKGKSLSRVRPLAWTAAYQAPPSMGISSQEYWSGVPLPSPKGMITGTQKERVQSRETPWVFQSVHLEEQWFRSRNTASPRQPLREGIRENISWPHFSASNNSIGVPHWLSSTWSQRARKPISVVHKAHCPGIEMSASLMSMLIWINFWMQFPGK